MKVLVHEEINRNYAVATHVVLSRICTALPDKPFESQVQGYMKLWVKNIEMTQCSWLSIFAPSRCESGDKLLVFCDSRRDEGRLIPDIGDASDESPFRMGLTCTSLWKRTSISSKTHVEPKLILTLGRHELSGNGLMSVRLVLEFEQ
ncbi:hypothetical protein GQ600_21914 [Phytophthora cactorum]|nr:hypothetical protein GQ600_21914 [Phytophthora cactorum]